jgi:hypothetical protein
MLDEAVNHMDPTRAVPKIEIDTPEDLCDHKWPFGFESWSRDWKVDGLRQTKWYGVEFSKAAH